jgi:hypothetical protein
VPLYKIWYASKLAAELTRNAEYNDGFTWVSVDYMNDAVEK